MERTEIFRPDGTLRGISYAKASKTRGAVLQLAIGRGTPRKLMTSLIVEGKDFNDVYRQAVKLIAEHFGVTDNKKLLEEMHASKKAFLSSYGLLMKAVCYQQVYAPE